MVLARRSQERVPHTQPAVQRRPRRGRTASRLRWLLLLGVATNAVLWTWHLRRAPNPQRSAAETCTARLAALGIAPPASGSSDAQVRLVPAAATAHVTAATVSRRQLYANMSKQLDATPLQIGTVATQGLLQSSLFSFEGSAVRPVLRRLEVPVRAIVAPFPDRAVAGKVVESVRRHLLPLMAPAGVWLQNDSMYHTTLWHASHHQNPVPASAAAIDAEAAAVRAVGDAACSMRVALERIIATPTGTVLACWQLVEGAEPAGVRHQLADALPNAPRAAVQAVREPDILHMTLARVLKAPVASGSAAAALQRAVAAMTAQLCGTQTTLREIWYVEELDLLALALRGAYRQRSMPLQCKGAAA